ncbi:oxidoreductase [Streptomyces mashuensis]|uniref:Oxidoreductase n=1 Tax=Streptomyces mashuensis TaxID=33904 RepID=A0A919EGG2_9ACTN|nr:PhzF family phenazine biosynthesis protein [Streptomyces mashuensis]GHF75240.1 oxidoreductase [Streptomyces mashuensis]
MRIRIVDAFTDRAFTGNPAGVMLLDSFPDDDRMRSIAAEVNHPETAFARPLTAAEAEERGADWALRWFTPLTEVDMCGHATLATAHVLHATGTASGTVRFAARCGVLVTTAHADGPVTMDFPTAPLTATTVPEGLPDALGAEPLTVLDTGPHVGDLLVELADEKTVRGLAPDLAEVARLSRRGVIATARAEDPARGYDYVSRGFFPNVGIDEDHVTGSAHTALAPFWSGRLGRTDLTGWQASARGGSVRTAVRGGRTLLTGRAVTVIDGELLA